MLQVFFFNSKSSLILDFLSQSFLNPQLVEGTFLFSMIFLQFLVAKILDRFST